jgi:hypothetical protein
VLSKREHGGHLSTNERRHVHFIDVKVSDLLTARNGFFDPDVGQWHIHPASEQLGSVPHGLAVAHQNEQ